MRDFDTLRDQIKQLGASLVEEKLHSESFGSAYAIFEGTGGRRFRLIWDGKEGYGFLQDSDSEGKWRDLPERVRGTSILQSQQVAALLSAAKRLINANGSV